MDFYNLDDRKGFAPIESSGIDVTLMSTIFMELEKNTSLKYVDDLAGMHIVYSQDCNLQKLSDKQYCFDVKKYKKTIHILITSGNDPFEFSIDNVTLYGSIINKKLNIEQSLNFSLPHCENLNDDEQKAFQWLENGQTGISSRTICGTIFPKLIELHGSFEDHENSHPKDVSDFKRCIGFFNAVPNAKQHLHLLSQLSDEWSNLIKEWDQIEFFINNKYNKDASMLLKTCVDINYHKKNKP